MFKVHGFTRYFLQSWTLNATLSSLVLPPAYCSLPVVGEKPLVSPLPNLQPGEGGGQDKGQRRPFGFWSAKRIFHLTFASPVAASNFVRTHRGTRSDPSASLSQVAMRLLSYICFLWNIDTVHFLDFKSCYLHNWAMLFNLPVAYFLTCEMGIILVLTLQVGVWTKGVNIVLTLRPEHMKRVHRHWLPGHIVWTTIISRAISSQV